MLKNVLIAALVLGFSANLSFAQDNLGLPDINSGTPVNELHFPKEKWGEDILKQLYKGPKYLNKDEVIEIDPAPANDSETTKQDLDVLRKYMAENRDEETIRLIKMEAGMSISPDIIFSKHGQFNNSEANDDSAGVLQEAVSETGYFILREKMRYGRARPTQLAPDLTLVIDIPAHASYPSGHGGQSYAAALVLSAFDPENKEIYMQLARDIGKRREIAGVHYPTDTTAGQKLAQQVIDKLMQDPEFKLKFEHAKEKFVKPELKK